MGWSNSTIPDAATEVQKKIERSIRNTKFDTVVSGDGLRREAMKMIVAERLFEEATLWQGKSRVFPSEFL